MSTGTQCDFVPFIFQSSSPSTLKDHPKPKLLAPSPVGFTRETNYFGFFSDVLNSVNRPIIIILLQPTGCCH